MNCVELYSSIYRRDPEGIAFCPYRICPIGAHSDHQLGKVTGMAINAGVRIAYGVKLNGVVELSSAQFERRAQWHVSSVPEIKQDDWADYLRGATLVLNDLYSLRYGLSAVIDAHKKLVPMQAGDVPVTYADTSALERDFGFKPSTSLRDGLRKFAEWYHEFYQK